VGVVKDVRLTGPEGGWDPAVYVPFAQQPIEFGLIHVVVKTHAEPSSLIPTIRLTASGIDPSVPAFNVRTFDQIRELYLAQRRFVMDMMLTFGGLAALLAVLGLYGVISYVVQLQRQEIGIRMALGASPSRVRFKVLWKGLLHGLIGVGIGSALAIAVVPALSRGIPNLGEVDPVSLAVLAVAGVAISAVAAWLPARRATLIDPVQALRAE
jgi:ABC-type lipoprotein release transport system permease subunit